MGRWRWQWKQVSQSVMDTKSWCVSSSSPFDQCLQDSNSSWSVQRKGSINMSRPPPPSPPRALQMQMETAAERRKRAIMAAMNATGEDHDSLESTTSSKSKSTGSSSSVGPSRAFSPSSTLVAPARAPLQDLPSLPEGNTYLAVDRKRAMPWEDDQ